MYLNIYQYLKNKETFITILLICLSFLVRIPTIFVLGDTALENEWKILVSNLVEHGTLSFRSFDNFLLPNLFMPPLYSYYLYFFSFFNLDDSRYVLTILLSQVFLSTISVIIFYKLNKFFFSQKISFYSSLLFSFFPLHVYACGQISSIILQTFFIILFFYLFFLFIKKSNFWFIFYLSISSGLLILLRGEFILIFILSLVYLFLFFKISLKKILMILLITLITISPYLIRNVVTFETFTITKSIGYNLWKGNNPNSKVEGSTYINPVLQKRINEVKKDKFYTINLDNIFLDQAIKNLKEDPYKYLILFFNKIISFLFIDINSSQPNYYNPLHYLFVLALGITSILGIILSNKKSLMFNYLILVFFANIIIFSCFFILPRYKLIIIPLQIIFSNVLAERIIKRYSLSK